MPNYLSCIEGKQSRFKDSSDSSIAADLYRNTDKSEQCMDCDPNARCNNLIIASQVRFLIVKSGSTFSCFAMKGNIEACKENNVYIKEIEMQREEIEMQKKEIEMQREKIEMQREEIEIYRGDIFEHVA